MRSLLRRPAAWGLGGLAAAVVVLAVAWDWNWVKHPVERWVLERTGRALVIGGQFDVRLGRSITITADKVSFANAPWGRAQPMATAERVSFVFSLVDAIKGQFVVPWARLTGAQVAFERNAQGERNWIFKSNEEKQGAPPRIQSLEVDRGEVAWLDSTDGLDIAAKIATTPNGREAAGKTEFDYRGTYHGTAFEGRGATGPVLQLEDTAAAIPLTLELHAPQIEVSLQGTVTDLPHLAGADVDFKAAGRDLAKLYPVLPITLPSSPPYTLSGHLKHQAGVWALSKLAGRVGDSDVAGDATFDATQTRHKFVAHLTSRVLDLKDLGPMIGMAPAPPRSKTTAKVTALPPPRAPRDPNRRVLPSAPFKLERLQSIDADVTLSAATLRRPEALALERVSARLQLANGQLRVAPLDFGFAGGEIQSSIALDSHRRPFDATLDARFSRIQLDKLLPTVKRMQDSAGRIGGQVHLKGRGESIATMLASADGSMGFAMSGGRMSGLLLEKIELDVGEIIKYLFAGDRQTEVRCAAAAFEMKQGVAKSQALVLDATNMRIDGHGEINFVDERLDLYLNPTPKEASILVLRSPINVRGTFAAPTASPEYSSVIARAGAAIGLGLLTPLAALLPLVDSGSGTETNCAQALKQADTAANRTPAKRPTVR